MAGVLEYLGLISPKDMDIGAYETTDGQCSNYNRCRNKATRIEHGARACASCVVRDLGDGFVSVTKR